MNKYIEFFDYVEEVIPSMPDEIRAMFQEVKNTFDKADKPLFTETGIMILEYLQNQEAKSFKAQEIAYGLEISSRRISGAMRKLVTDGYVSKKGQNPVSYSLTEQGKNFNITNYKESLNNEN